MKLKPILLAIPLLLSNGLVAETPLTSTNHLSEEYSPLADKYIRAHEHLAVAEMERTAIPASITLAQGMLESGYGTSELAKHANNHFGIKCHKGWTGETYTRRSKENVDGSSIVRNSCFRAYSTTAESYADHSDFLASRSNYSALFLANTTDYKVWAEGLVKGGYATDPKYAAKLISTIQAYRLDKYDTYTNTVLAFNNTTAEQEYQEDIPALKRRIQTLESILSQTELYKEELQECLSTKQQEVARLKDQQADLKRQLEEKIQLLDGNLAIQYDMIADLQKRLQRVENIQQDMIKADPLANYFNEDGSLKDQVAIFPPQKLDSEGIFYQSGRKATVVSKDYNLMEISDRYNIAFKDLLKYNDLSNDVDLEAGYYVYLEPKANYVKDENKPHQVVIGETMHSISQRYGIKSSKLYQRNHLRVGQEPQLGEFIFLNKNNDKRPTLKPQGDAGNFDAKFGGGGAGQR
jgi:LysM repeat protein